MTDSYDRWNHAILSYFVEGLPRGASVFLSVDDDIIPQIGRELGVPKEQSLWNFRSAVRQHILEGERVKLHRVDGRNSFGEPNGVAFLAAMVLAASYMAKEEGTSPSNYFRRLCEVLALPPNNSHPRPLGMNSGDEEPLWQEWARWLQENSLLPSAYPGEAAMRYINYPISQALLRRTDKDRLRRFFVEKRLGRDLDIETLFIQLHREKPNPSQHLQELLDSQGQRYQAVTEVIYDFYGIWCNDLDSPQNITGTSHTPRLLMELYRTEDYFSGDIQYFLYPRVPRRHRVEHLQIWFAEAFHTLTKERPGWYSPLGPIIEKELDQGARYDIKQPADFDAFVLPQREFWILIPDSQNPDSNVYASWDAPSLGIPFILLCRKELVPQLNHLRGERLIEWSGEPCPLTINEQWVEIYNCMVILQEWSGVHIENQQLHNALQPKEHLNINASGGLRVPKLGGWLEGYGPKITVFGFEPQVDMDVIHVENNIAIMHQSLPTNKPVDVVWPGSGDYRVEARCRGDRARERLVKIVTWELLHMTVPERQESLNLGASRIRGAYIEEKN